MTSQHSSDQTQQMATQMPLTSRQRCGITITAIAAITALGMADASETSTLAVVSATGLSCGIAALGARRR